MKNVVFYRCSSFADKGERLGRVTLPEIPKPGELVNFAQYPYVVMDKRHLADVPVVGVRLLRAYDPRVTAPTGDIPRDCPLSSAATAFIVTNKNALHRENPSENMLPIIRLATREQPTNRVSVEALAEAVWLYYRGGDKEVSRYEAYEIILSYDGEHYKEDDKGLMQEVDR